MVDAIVHLEIPVTKIGAAIEFYSKVFGWKVYERQGFTVFETGSGSVNGSFKRVRRKPREGISFYVKVESIEEKLRDVARYGGVKTSDVVELPGIGLQVSIADPSGNRLYLFTPVKR